MKRRTVLQLAAAMLATPGGAFAQARTYRMSYLGGSSAAASAPLQKVFFARLEELGYREGRNLVVDRRFAEGNLGRLPALAAELVALKPDVLFAVTSPPALAALKATSTIPVVFAAVSDPVSVGIVKNLARPGMNATGVSSQNADLQGRRLQIVREVFPAAARVAVLHNPLNAAELPIVASLQEAGKKLGLALRVIELKSEHDFDPAFKAIEAGQPNLLYVIESSFTYLHRARIVEFANSRRLPGMYGLADFADVGGLMSYSFNLIEQYRAAATYIDRILKGAKPAELPVEQPTRFELVLNLKTAKALGVRFPRALLLGADRVIE